MCGGGNVIGGDRSFTWLNGLIRSMCKEEVNNGGGKMNEDV